MKKSKTKSLRDHFKIAPFWDHADPFTADELLSKISFAFTMEPAHYGLYFKINEPVSDMDCFQFAFDVDNGIYINDGDMRFNEFMGQRINDSGVEIIEFMKDYLRKENLQHLIL